METLGALAIIAAIVALIVWLLVRRPGDGGISAPAKPPEAPRPITPEQALEIVRSTIKVTVGEPGARQRYVEGTYPTKAVGESYNQAALRSIAEAHPERGPLDDSADCEVQAMLIPEPDNLHDVNAVRAEIDGKKVGYLSRGDAARYRSQIGVGQTPVRALIVGGWNNGRDNRGDYGVRLAFRMTDAGNEENLNSLRPGITLTPGSYSYDVAGVDMEGCATLTSVGSSALAAVDLVPVPEEQSVSVTAGDVFLGWIYGMDAQVILRTGRVGAVPARVRVGRRDGPPRYPGDPKVWASVRLAVAIDTTTILREPVVDGCARTPGAYAEHVQGVHRYTATLKKLCPDGLTGHARAVLCPTEGGFLVTIAGADVGTVLGTSAGYASSHASADIEVDALIVKRVMSGGRGYWVYLAIELARPAEA